MTSQTVCDPSLGYTNNQFDRLPKFNSIPRISGHGSLIFGKTQGLRCEPSAFRPNSESLPVGSTFALKRVAEKGGGGRIGGWLGESHPRCPLPLAKGLTQYRSIKLVDGIPGASRGRGSDVDAWGLRKPGVARPERLRVFRPLYHGLLAVRPTA